MNTFWYKILGDSVGDCLNRVFMNWVGRGRIEDIQSKIKKAREAPISIGESARNRITSFFYNESRDSINNMND